MKYRFDRGTGRYRDLETGRFVPRATVLKEVDREMLRTQIRLQGVTRLLTSGKITIEEWQTRFALTLKDAHIRTMGVGAGGKDRLTNAHYGAVGQAMRKEYKYLDRFAGEIAQGKHTERYILNRAGLYAASVRQSFYKGEQIGRVVAGAVWAKRVLDPQVRHCKQCPGYATRDWVPIEKIVPPGQACDCGGRCRCQIIYKPVKLKRDGLSDRLDAIVMR